MPEYAFACENCGTKWLQFRSMQQAHEPLHCRCGRKARRDYQAERKEVGFIDGASEGWYPADTGFPYAGHQEPGKRLNRVCPSEKAWKEYIARKEGKVADVS